MQNQEVASSNQPIINSEPPKIARKRTIMRDHDRYT